MDVTAIVLSSSLCTCDLPNEIKVFEYISKISSPAELQNARYDAIKYVTTSNFFYLDDDDELPVNILEVLESCLKVDSHLAYTDEIIINELGFVNVRRGRPYSQNEHLRDPMLIHHLTLCRTDSAKRAVETIPVGDYCPEMMLYWQMAKMGAAHVPEIGYVWHRRSDGMHAWPQTVISQVRAALWCQANR